MSYTLLLFTAYAIVRTVPSANRPNRRKKKLPSSFIFAPHPAYSSALWYDSAKDAAVSRLAKSQITQLTLCQVTASEMDAATKLLDKACQKLQGVQNIPAQRVTDLEATIR